MANDSLNTLIKRLAIAAVEQKQLSTFIVGSVVAASPLKIKINQKLFIDKEFFAMTQTAKDAKLKKGDKVALIRAYGGQSYLLIDKVV